MVTGASSRLGRELCLDLARAGCKIIAAAHRTNRLQSLCDEINELDFSVLSSALTPPPPPPLSSALTSPMGAVESRRAVAVELDVCANGKSIEESVTKAWDYFEFIDTLVNNAGNVKSPLELSEKEWDDTMGTNLKGQWLVYAYSQTNKANRGGSIINIYSISGLDRALQRGALAKGCLKHFD
ncbi:3-oxoacyl-(acyl-carrier-protein) reductase FabG-like isoform X4 [Cucumis melo var. makuwa]|uniref:3-oxoacyl-(Acyl-carrier-protein) reductase FabG-like isoform X4 n=1 Tax=Cucumis melo var. makuwa TaxID=1194695 RepID=A0A5A7UTF9_CUCMM|nr:3-oxoacyl-(acyl-carrier-protein) reductase FabG-like isoform X4 [Cucumis melo var. makuwa]